MNTPHDVLLRIADTIDRLPESWRGVQTRVDLFHALEAAFHETDLDARRYSWEKIRYLAGFPTGTGIRMPLYAAVSTAGDPMQGAMPPSYADLLATLSRVAGWETQKETR